MGNRRWLKGAVIDKKGDGAAVIRHDARDLPLNDGTVDLIVTSPPYFAMRSYRDDDGHIDEQIGSEDTPDLFLDTLDECMVEWGRVLKPGGSVWINLGDKYAGSVGGNTNLPHAGPADADRPTATYQKPRRLDTDIRAKSLMGLPWRFAIRQIDTGWILRAEVVWSKPNGLPESVTDRVRRSHEQWFHFTKELRYFSAVDEIREPHKPESLARAKRQSYEDRYRGDNGHHTLDPDQFNNPLGRLPGSVWTIPTEPLTIPDNVRQLYDLPDHFAAFPQEWPRRIILGWSPSGVCVECGEGRIPVLDRSPMEVSYSARRSEALENGAGSGRTTPSGTMTKPPEAAITGYACACPTLDAPTTPAVVLDPFGGTGTTAGVARTHGRYGISNDISAAYNRLAAWRIWDSGHFERGQEKWVKARTGGPLNETHRLLMTVPGVGEVAARNLVEKFGGDVFRIRDEVIDSSSPKLAENLSAMFNQINT